MNLKVIVLLIAGMTASFAQGGKKPASQASAKASNEGIFADIETSKGKITLELEYKKTPVTVANFIALAEGTNTIVGEQYKGKPFYNGLKFHRVIKDFMIQGGDPLGNGSGDPGYKFKDEITDLKHNAPGILSMANSGPGTNGSQFFITHKETSWLDGKHTVFGHVVSGQDVVNAIAQDDLINKVTIVRKGSDAKKFDASKVFADYFANKADDDRKKAEADAEAKKAAEAKIAPVKKDKVAYFAGVRSGATKTDSGLEYKIIQAGSGKKPADGTPVFIHYAGYLEDGSLFDSSYADINKTYGKYDEARGSQNGYQPFPFTAGKKDGLIPGFTEALTKMSIGDKAVAFIPSKLGYGERGAGNVIPPNTNIIFEIELLDAMPAAAPKQ
ncbi:MAG TPA: peptidylprolyl isomerase [Flavobacterium sp.]|jgi:cyclophilin family peptidyl-prolyl cis-trans isomerase